MDGLDCYTGQPNESVMRRRRTVEVKVASVRTAAKAAVGWVWGRAW